MRADLGPQRALQVVELLASELLTNAVKYGPATGAITVLVLFAVMLTSQGRLPEPASALSIGGHTIKAVYNGDDSTGDYGSSEDTVSYTINKIAGQIDGLRKRLADTSFPQVTATPYSLYLQIKPDVDLI